MTCDHAFADYLIYQSRRLRVVGIYIRTLKIVLIMRNYLNQDGYQHINKDSKSNSAPGSLSFTENEKPKFITLFSNLFMIYAKEELKDKEWMPLKNELADEVEQICTWLYTENYTNYKLIRAATNEDTTTLWQQNH